ncbi:MAG: type VI secretion system tube protein Hcp [Candidatus Tectomicrobia bacterium]|nr:type VI secretion system tube protein Hcp [Candidatus Tectomicrobia bacterium]
MANDAFMKVFGPDLSGESTDVDHKDWIEVMSYSLGMNQPVSTASGTGGRSAGRVGFSDFSVMKQVDKSSLDLMLHCCKGTHFSKVELQVHEASGEKHQFLIWTLEDVIISSIQPSGSQGSDKPMESVAFNFGKVKWTYTPLAHDGSAGSKVGPVGWDLETNKPQ